MAVAQVGKAESAARVDSMDQFRGYTMAGMFLVNFVGAFAVTHPLLKHHNTYNSYADTIMPHFFFAVGFSMRLVMLRNIAQMGDAAYRKAAFRSLMLVLVGLIVYHLDGEYRQWDQTQGARMDAAFSRQHSGALLFRRWCISASQRCGFCR